LLQGDFLAKKLSGIHTAVFLLPNLRSGCFYHPLSSYRDALITYPLIVSQLALKIISHQSLWPSYDMLDKLADEVYLRVLKGGLFDVADDEEVAFDADNSQVLRLSTSRSRGTYVRSVRVWTNLMKLVLSKLTPDSVLAKQSSLPRSWRRLSTAADNVPADFALPNEAQWKQFFDFRDHFIADCLQYVMSTIKIENGKYTDQIDVLIQDDLRLDQSHCPICFQTYEYSKQVCENLDCAAELLVVESGSVGIAGVNPTSPSPLPSAETKPKFMKQKLVKGPPPSENGTPIAEKSKKQNLEKQRYRKEIHLIEDHGADSAQSWQEGELRASPSKMQCQIEASTDN
jgi:hypothetical protein